MRIQVLLIICQFCSSSGKQVLSMYDDLKIPHTYLMRHTLKVFTWASLVMHWKCMQDGPCSSKNCRDFVRRDEWISPLNMKWKTSCLRAVAERGPPAANMQVLLSTLFSFSVILKITKIVFYLFKLLRQCVVCEFMHFADHLIFHLLNCSQQQL